MNPISPASTDPAPAVRPAPRVSICVPTYNGAAFLRECLESLQRQTFADFEVVIVDDDSRDGSFEIAAEFARGDERFHVHRNPQRLGLVGNCRRSLEIARAEWIKFAFQDDVLRPACLEKLLAACERTGKPFGFCERGFIFDDGTGAEVRQWFETHARRLREDYQTAAVIEPGLAAKIAVREPAHNPVGEPTVTLIHRSLFQELGGFDEALIQLVDAEFWQRVLVNHGAAHVPEELAGFRIHARAASTVNRQERAFRMGLLDLLVLRHRFAFGRHFKNLRHSAAAARPGWALRRDCALTAARAWREAREKNRAGDPSFLAEWRTVRQHCRGLQTLARIGLVLELPGRLKRAFTGKNQAAR
jgi:glycosyltransferase involved in cell wall biosynthesis